MEGLKSALIIGFIRLLGLFPLRVVHALGWFIGRIAWISGSRMREVTETNLRLCLPDMPAAERERLARDSLVETARAMMETGMAWMWPEARSLALVRAVRNAELLDACMADTRGVIVIVPHIGNWELLNHYFSSQYHGYALYRPPKLEAVDRFVLERRSGLGHGIELVPTTREGVEYLYDAARKGGCIFILPDQEPSEKSGVYAPFFGVQALSSKLVPLMRAETGAEVICGYVIRLLGSQGYEVRFRRPEPGYDSPDLVTAVTALNRTVERVAMEAPAQYQWEYKRFKRRPPGEPKVY